jgi:hypothetical protein
LIAAGATEDKILLWYNYLEFLSTDKMTATTTTTPS